MTKKTIPTIYSCLDLTFWLQRQCTKCQAYFTKQDYQTQNYQLTFREVLTINHNVLAVAIQPTHKTCCPGCFNYLKDLYQTKLKSHVPKT